MKTSFISSQKVSWNFLDNPLLLGDLLLGILFRARKRLSLVTSVSYLEYFSLLIKGNCI